MRAAGILIAVLILLLTDLAFAQLTVVLHQPPPNRLRVSDLWVVDLINPTKTTLKVYLHGTANEVTIPSRPILVVDAQSAPFLLPPGFHRVTGSDISPIKVNTTDPTYRNIVTTTGVVPSGNYLVCVEVKDFTTDTRLGIDCYEQTIDNSSPPILVTPFDGSEVAEKLPIFTWIPPAPINNFHVSYALKIVEIMGQQSAYDAMVSNYSYFSASRIQPTLFQYPLASRPLEQGKRYAWKIDAISTGTVRPFLVGESETWEFTYQPLSVDHFASGSSLTGADINSGSSGRLADSLRLHNLWESFVDGNFYIPYNSVNLSSSNIAIDPLSLGDIALYSDPNARRFVSNAPNDTAHGEDCLRGPNIHLAFDYPMTERAPANWSQAFGIDWSVIHNAPLDHIDLRIALWGHEEAPLAHYIYRASSGSIAASTTFDPRPFILNPSAGGIVCVITAAAIDINGRSSGKVRKLYMAGTFSLPPPVVAPDSPPWTGLNLAMSSASSILINGTDVDGEHHTIVSPTIMIVSPSAMPTITVVNRDTRPHHFHSGFTPPYPESSSLSIGGVTALDATELPPGASSTLHLPVSAPACYVWTLFDEDDPLQTHSVTIRVAPH